MPCRTLSLLLLLHRDSLQLTPDLETSSVCDQTLFNASAAAFQPENKEGAGRSVQALSSCGDAAAETISSMNAFIKSNMQRFNGRWRGTKRPSVGLSCDMKDGINSCTFKSDSTLEDQKKNNIKSLSVFSLTFVNLPLTLICCFQEKNQSQRKSRTNATVLQHYPFMTVDSEHRYHWVPLLLLPDFEQLLFFYSPFPFFLDHKKRKERHK